MKNYYIPKLNFALARIYNFDETAIATEHYKLLKCMFLTKGVCYPIYVPTIFTTTALVTNFL